MDPGTNTDRIRTNVPRADEVFDGGLVPESATLVRGAPGAGKTIFGLHVLAGEASGAGLYINLGEPTAYLRETAQAFSLDTGNVSFLDLSPSATEFQDETTYDLFHSGEVETAPLVEAIRAQVAEASPERVVIDPVTESSRRKPRSSRE